MACRKNHKRRAQPGLAFSGLFNGCRLEVSMTISGIRVESNPAADEINFRACFTNSKGLGSPAPGSLIGSERHLFQLSL